MVFAVRDPCVRFLVSCLVVRFDETPSTRLAGFRCVLRTGCRILCEPRLCRLRRHCGDFRSVGSSGCRLAIVWENTMVTSIPTVAFASRRDVGNHEYHANRQQRKGLSLVLKRIFRIDADLLSGAYDGAMVSFPTGIKRVC